MSGHTDNRVVIEAPMDVVWRITNDVEHWPDLFTEYASAQILERRGASVRFRLTMHPDASGAVWSWISERTPDEATRTVRAHRVETGAFKYMALFWEYLPVEDGVVMRWVQDFEMRPGAPLDDDGMTQRLNANTTAQMAIIKQKVELAARVNG